MAFAYSRLPYLVKRLEKYNLDCPFHRWDPYPIKYKGGKSFFSYGRVHYRDYSIRLHGRFLVDTTTSVGNEVDVADGRSSLFQTDSRFNFLFI